MNCSPVGPRCPSRSPGRAPRCRRRWRALAAPSQQAELVEILKVVDERQRNNGDWRSLVYMEQKERDKVDVVYEALVFRRSEDQKFMILFTKPKASQGQGYLRMDKNLWFYDPSVGKWERRTERERIGGTNSRRSDFDESRLAEEYDPEFVGEEKLGAYTAMVHEPEGQARARPGLPGRSSCGWTRRPRTSSSARSSRCRAGCCAPSYYPKWKKHLQRVEEGRRLVPAGDPLLRRGGEGEPDADPDQDRRPQAAGAQPLHQGLAGEQIAMSRPEAKRQDAMTPSRRTPLATSWASWRLACQSPPR